jgi:hypothetical protein
MSPMTPPQGGQNSRPPSPEPRPSPAGAAVDRMLAAAQGRIARGRGPRI